MLATHFFTTYAYMQASHFRVVKVLMTTANSSPSAHTHYITFQAQKRNTGSFVTFQTKIVVSGCPCPRFQILFVRIKPDHNNSQPSEFDNNAQVVEDRTLLSQLINKYTIVCLRVPFTFSFTIPFFFLYCIYIYDSYI